MFFTQYSCACSGSLRRSSKPGAPLGQRGICIAVSCAEEASVDPSRMKKNRSTKMQRRNKLTPIGFTLLPLVGQASRSSAKIHHSYPIFITQPLILPPVTGGEPSLNETSRSYRIY